MSSNFSSSGTDSAGLKAGVLNEALIPSDAAITDFSGALTIKEAFKAESKYFSRESRLLKVTKPHEPFLRILTDPPTDSPAVTDSTLSFDNDIPVLSETASLISAYSQSAEEIIFLPLSRV